MTKWIAPALTALGVSALLAGCGTAVSTGSTGPNDLLAKVESTHQLSIAESAFAPEDFQDPTTKQWTGYDIDILRGFAKSLGATLSIDALPFAASIQAVADKRADLTIDIYWTAERAKVIDYSRPMLNYDDVVAVNGTNPTVSGTTVADLSGKKIAVVIGSGEVAEATAVPNAQVTQYNSVGESFLALSSGRVDADFEPDIDVPWAQHSNPSLNIKILGPVPASISPPLASLRGYYGVPKGKYSARFLQKLNAYLQRIACNGQEQQMIDKYGMTSSVFLAGICTAPNTYSGGK